MPIPATLNHDSPAMVQVPTRGLGTNWRARWAATVLRGSGYDRDMEPRVITAAELERMISAEHDRVQGPIDAERGEPETCSPEPCCGTRRSGVAHA